MARRTGNHRKAATGPAGVALRWWRADRDAPPVDAVRLLDRAEDGKWGSPLVADLRANPVTGVGLAVAVAVVGVQFLILLVHSWHQYRQFDLGLDFGLFEQAWFGIAHGHLSPNLTINPILNGPTPYWRSHFELIMWPLAATYWLWPNDGFTLLAVQDLAISGAGLVTVWWMYQLARVRQINRWFTAAALVGLAAIGATDPWLYGSARQDFHFEAVAAFFALGAAYELWAGHHRRCWVLVALTLACGDVSATYLVGIGIAMAVALPRARRQGLVIGAVGFVWLGLVAALGANQGSPIGTYSYLAGHPLTSGGVGSLAAIARGIVSHPSRPIRRLVDSRHDILRLLQPTGIIGVFCPWVGLGVILVLLENVLSAPDEFRLPEFQNFPVYLLTTAGTGLVILLVASPSRRRITLAIALLAVAVVPSLSFNYGRTEFGAFSSSVEAGIQLAAIRSKVPANAEVISSFGVLGRFAGRPSIHTFLAGGNTVPLDEKTVVVVFAPSVGNEPTPLGMIMDFEELLVSDYHASIIYQGSLASAYEFSPPAGQGSMVLPT